MQSVYSGAPADGCIFFIKQSILVVYFAYVFVLFFFFVTGTHWLWEVVGMLLRGKAERIKVEKEHYMLECSDAETLEKLESPRILNSHIYKEQVPETILQNNKIILISRNPKDIAVSWYNHNVADLETDYEGKFPAFYELYRVGNGEYFLFLFSFLFSYRKYSRIIRPFFFTFLSIKVRGVYKTQELNINFTSGLVYHYTPNGVIFIIYFISIIQTK